MMDIRIHVGLEVSLKHIQLGRIVDGSLSSLAHCRHHWLWGAAHCFGLCRLGRSVVTSRDWGDDISYKDITNIH